MSEQQSNTAREDGQEEPQVGRGSTFPRPSVLQAVRRFWLDLAARLLSETTCSQKRRINMNFEEIVGK
jgi:hypothetical protein